MASLRYVWIYCFFMQEKYSQHIPVLMDEVLAFLQPGPGNTYIDGTLGGGGHTEALLQRSAPDGKVLGIDTDELALERVQRRLAPYIESGRLLLAHGNFAEMEEIAARYDVAAVQGILLDLGFSSDQMDNPERGFSFSADGPLDMRLDQSLPLSAADLVNTASEQELADIFWRYGEETRSRQIAHRIVHERARAAITRTGQLAKLMAAGIPYQPNMNSSSNPLVSGATHSGQPRAGTSGNGFTTNGKSTGKRL